jgi:hypothetical protein
MAATPIPTVLMAFSMAAGLVAPQQYRRLLGKKVGTPQAVLGEWATLR